MTSHLGSFITAKDRSASLEPTRYRSFDEAWSGCWQLEMRRGCGLESIVGILRPDLVHHPSSVVALKQWSCGAADGCHRVDLLPDHHQLTPIRCMDVAAARGAVLNFRRRLL